MQDRNGLEVSSTLAEDMLDFDIEMETGTGKTHVLPAHYFRTGATLRIQQIHNSRAERGDPRRCKHYICLMREHFRDLYPAHPFDASVYSGDKAEEVQLLSTATSVQILVMTIDAVRGDKKHPHHPPATR